MARNKAFIERMKKLHRNIKTETEQIYAGVALALHREYGFGYVRINRIIQQSLIIWEECAEKGIDMTQMCLEETGIDVQKKC